MKIWSAHLIEHLLMQAVVGFIRASPLVDERTQILEDTFRFLIACLALRRSGPILQDTDLCLHLLEPMHGEEPRQVSRQAVRGFRKEMPGPIQGALEPLVELC